MKKIVMFSSDQGYSLVPAEVQGDGTLLLETLPSVAVAIKKDGEWTATPLLPSGRLMRDLTRWVAHGKTHGVAKVLESGDFISVSSLPLQIGGQKISFLPKIILSQIAENIQLGNGQARRVAGLADDDMQPICGLLNIKQSERYFALFPSQRVTSWPSLAQARELLKLPITATIAKAMATKPTKVAKKLAKKVAKKK
jgi:hypothetical protein